MDDDSCVMKYIEIVPLDSFNNFPDVTHIKQEPDTVEVYLIYVFLSSNHLTLVYHCKYFTIYSFAKWLFCPSCATGTAAFFSAAPMQSKPMIACMTLTYLLRSDSHLLMTYGRMQMSVCQRDEFFKYAFCYLYRFLETLKKVIILVHIFCLFFSVSERRC